MELGLKSLKQGSGDCAVIFIHGVLSAGDKCWSHDNGTYWPNLLVQDSALGDLSVFVYTYETGIFSADYNLEDVVADLREWMRSAGVEGEPRIIFVCHSMGGIVARRYLVRRHLDRDAPRSRTTFGLFLVASPSLGSEWANWLQPIAEFLGHSQADALRFSEQNNWLNGLDGDFRRLIHLKGEELHGRELVEDKFVVGGFFFAPKVVARISAAHYFPNELKIAGSDHSSIAKPENAVALQHQALRDFVKALPKPQPDPAQMVRTTNDALNVLIANANEPVIRETVGRFRDAFENANTQIMTLKHYKGLHDSLHKLQLVLDTIEDALDRSKIDSAAAGTLGKHAVVLHGIAREARKQITDLPNARLEQTWISKLETYADFMQRAARPFATQIDFDRLADIGLGELLNHASRINRTLTRCMSSLRLTPLSESMRMIAEKLRPIAKPGDKALQQLDAGSQAVYEMHGHLEQFVSEHYEWQWFSNELDHARLSSKHQPSDKMSNWEEFKERFTRLCDQDPNESWANELKQLMEHWIAATPSAQPSYAETIAGENAFDAFYQDCLERFVQIDTDLKDLSVQIASVAGNLVTVLTVIT
ncbi:pimeloyl-ACP methyl ester carboxylesterase [Bradyrhizobium sp. USDA 3240]